METRANFILIGAFTILGIFGALGFFIWLASVQIDRQYAQYGVLFDNVAGLDPSGDVLFNGVGVGRVIEIRIWENDPRLVFVGIEIDAATPVSSDTVAQLKSQGVTGVAYIELSGGDIDAIPLPLPDAGPPIIPSRRSTVQTLVEDAPDILEDVTVVMAQLQALTGPENQAYVQSILNNLEATSGQLDQALSDFSEITGTVREAVDQITVFTARLDDIGVSVTNTLSATDETLAAATDAFEEADRVLESTSASIASAEAAFAAGRTLLETDLPRIAAEFGTSLASIDKMIGELAARSTTSFDIFDLAAENASDAFTAATALMNTDLAPMLSDIQGVAADISRVTASIAADIPEMTADLRAVIARMQGIAQDIEAVINAGTPGLTAFITTGLSQFTQLGQESRSLVRSLNDLVRRIESNPTRFLLDDRVPEYRR